MSVTSRQFAFGSVCALALLAIAGPQPVRAQGQQPAAGPAMEEIVVTARKRTESLVDVPISISAFSADTIAAAGMTSIKDVARFTPNFSFAESFGRTFERPVIRGMSNILGEPNAGIFIDGVFVSGAISTTELQNLERVEVIKGPQSALYGRATFAGAVNYVTKKPSNDPQGRVSATLAQHDEYEVAASHSGPLIADRLFYFVSARHYEYGGEYENRGPGGGTVGGEQTQSLTGSLRLTPVEWLEANLRVAYSEDDDAHIPNSLQLSGANNCFIPQGTYFCGALTAPDFVALNLDLLPDPGMRRETLRSHLIVEADIGGHTLTSSTATFREDEENQRDADGVPQNILGGAFLQVSQAEREDFAQELRLASPTDRAFRWLVGGYYYEKTTDARTTTLNTTGPITSTSPPEEVLNYALFGFLEYDFTPRLTATAELRAGWDELSVSGVSTSGTLSRAYTAEATYESLTPRFTLSYEASEDSTLYASVAKGNKPGGFNTGIQSPNLPDAERARLSRYATIDEEEAWNYEVGAKGSFLNGAVSLNASLFYIDWTNQQLTTTERYTSVRGVPTNIALIVNAGETEVRGAELEARLRLSERFTVSGAYGRSEAKFVRFEDATNLRLTGQASVEGNRTPRAPLHTAVLSAEYRHPLTAALNAFARGDVLHEGTRYVQVDNFTSTGASTKVNLKLGLESERWEVSAWVKNLTDDRTPSDATRLTDPFNFRPAYQIALPRGRQIGVTATTTF